MWATGVNSVQAQHLKEQCAVPENVHTTPTEGIGISWGGGGFYMYETNKFKGCRKHNRNFQRGGEMLEKIPSVGEVLYGYFLALHNTLNF